jgi:5-methyltetrahydrofolate--homocysteine methyltransferase
VLDRIARGEVLVADGAWGTMLMARGLETGVCPELWNLEHPDVVAEIARAYADAGADLITTNTFGGSSPRLALHGLEGRAHDINRIAAATVKESLGTRVLILGSVGPTGLLLKPHGDTEPGRVFGAFEDQIAALAEGGSDAICIETMIDLAEATLAVRAARSVAPGLPVITTMTFNATPRGFFTIMGGSIESAVTGLVAAGADIVGANCGNGIDQMVEIARELARSTSVPFAIQANAGLPTLRGNELVYPETPEHFSARVPDLLAAGASIIGGCCGTTPAHIRAIRDRVDYLRPERSRRGSTDGLAPRKRT